MINNTILISRPLYHSAVLTGELLVALMSGAKIVFLSEKFNPLSIWGELCRTKVTVFCGTPSMLNMLARYKRSSYDDTVRLITISGEPLHLNIGSCIRNAFPNAQIFHVYGLTEASPRISYLPSHLFDSHCDCVGIALPSVSFKILRKDGTQAQKGESGILWVNGNNIMLGYYEDSKQTKAVLQNGWLCTGDIAMLNPEGLLFIKGRADDIPIQLSHYSF